MNEGLAISKAKKLLKKVKGKGWKISVWENLGWHYCLRGDFISLYEHQDKTYHAMISTDIDGIGGLAMWTGNRYYKNPNTAINYAIKKAEKCLAELTNAVKQARGCAVI